MLAKSRLNFVWRYNDKTNEIVVIIPAKISPQKIRKFVDDLFSFPTLYFVVFKSFLVDKQITPKLISEQINTTAKSFNGDNSPVIKTHIEVSNIETNEVNEQNNILLKIIFLGLIG